MGIYLLKDNQQTGPYEDSDVRSGLATGKFSYDSLAWREGMAEWQPLSTLFLRVGPPKPPVQAPNRSPSLRCQTCGQAELVKRKTYRMSTPVVVIGFLLLIPSILGILFGGLMLMTTVLAGGTTANSSDKEVRAKLVVQAVPESIIREVLSGKTISVAEKSSLTAQQRSAIDDAEISVSAGNIGTGMGILIGWILFWHHDFFIYLRVARLATDHEKESSSVHPVPSSRRCVVAKSFAISLLQTEQNIFRLWRGP